MKKPGVPCRDCEDRDEACHAACEKYKAYKEDLYKYERLKRKGRENTRKIKIKNKKGDWYR